MPTIFRGFCTGSEVQNPRSIDVALKEQLQSYLSFDCRDEIYTLILALQSARWIISIYHVPGEIYPARKRDRERHDFPGRNVALVGMAYARKQGKYA
jgi:hypothetical protein